jgi:Uma2 family endonuclease
MGHPSKKEAGAKYTWQDYLTWPEDERWEVIDGRAYAMTPSPSFGHQRLAGNLFAILREKLRGKRCIPAIAPLDVYLDEHNFVQPDVLVVCDPAKIKDRIYGAPDVVIEVLSPSTGLKDKREKKSLYERFGVREYILIHPEELLIERYWLDGGKFQGPDLLGAGERLVIRVLEELEIALWEVFDVAPPEPEKEQDGQA